MNNYRTLGKFLRSMHLPAKLEERPGSKQGHEEHFSISGQKGQFNHQRLNESVLAYYNLLDYSSSASQVPDMPGRFIAQNGRDYLVELSISPDQSEINGIISKL